MPAAVEIGGKSRQPGESFQFSQCYDAENHLRKKKSNQVYSRVFIISRRLTLIYVCVELSPSLFCYKNWREERSIVEFLLD